MLMCVCVCVCVRACVRACVGSAHARMHTPTQVQLDLNDNELEGRIPEEYGQLAQLHRLDLHNNLLEGAIPEPLLSERMGQLSHLDLSANRLVGSIPRGLCRMTHLASLNLASNAGLLAAQRRVATCAAPCVSVCMHVPGALTPSRP